MLGVRVVVVVPYRLRNGLCYPCFTDPPVPEVIEVPTYAWPRQHYVCEFQDDALF